MVSVGCGAGAQATNRIIKNDSIGKIWRRLMNLLYSKANAVELVTNVRGMGANNFFVGTMS
jgi:hypothetical protein